MRKLALFEKKMTLTELNVSIAYKLLLARFLNSAILLVLANWDPLTWYEIGGLAYTASVNILLMSI